MTVWLRQVRDALSHALSRLAGRPLALFANTLALGLALLLPAVAWTILDNAEQRFSSAARAELGLFLSAEAQRRDVDAVEKALRGEAGVAHWRFVPRDEALARLRRHPALGDVAAGLPRNPLPDAFVVEAAGRAPDELARLRDRLARYPGVAHVQFDAGLSERVHALLGHARVALLGLLLLFAVLSLAVVFNTVRLELRHNETERTLLRLLGATPAFIRRPYCYFGALQGLLAGTLALCLLIVGFFLIAPALSELLGLFGAPSDLHLPPPEELAALPALGTATGWLAARLVFLRR